MPLILLAFTGGGLAGLTLGGGLSDTARAVKWVVIGGIVYYGYKTAKGMKWFKA
jgi:hypothetical protein